jgi:hypothetical protein
MTVSITKKLKLLVIKNNMKLNLDYKFKYSDEELKKLDEVKANVTVNYIHIAVSQKYPDGLDGQLRRVWGRIQRKFDDAFISNQYDIVLEEAEKDFIKKAFETCKYPTNVATYVNLFEDEFINNLNAK